MAVGFEQNPNPQWNPFGTPPGFQTGQTDSTTTTTETEEGPPVEGDENGDSTTSSDSTSTLTLSPTYSASSSSPPFDPVASSVIDSSFQPSVEEVQAWIHDSEMQIIQAMLDALDRSLENARKLNEQLKEYIRKVVIPREEYQKHQDTLEVGRDKTQANSTQRELNSALGKLQTCIQQSLQDPKVQANPGLANDIAQLQVTLNTLLNHQTKI